MKGLRVVVAIFALWSCSAVPPVVPADFSGLATNACLPEAIVMSETLHSKGVDSRILIVTTPTYSHAMVVFLYPVEQPKTWVWDADSKSVEIDADFADPRAVAKAWLDATLRESRVLTASYL